MLGTFFFSSVPFSKGGREIVLGEELILEYELCVKPLMVVWNVNRHGDSKLESEGVVSDSNCNKEGGFGFNFFGDEAINRRVLVEWKLCKVW